MNKSLPSYVPVSVAALRLGICRTRVVQLIEKGCLDPVFEGGGRYVSVVSIARRQRLLKQRRQKLPRV